MKLKIKDSKDWLIYKPTTTITKILSYYKTSESLYEVLSLEQTKLIKKIILLEDEFSKKTKNTSSSINIPIKYNKEPQNSIENMDITIDFLITSYYPLLKELKKQINKDKRILMFGASQEKYELQNFFYNVNHKISNLLKGQQLIDDIYNKKTVLENSAGNFSFEHAVKGVSGYICGNIEGTSFYGHNGGFGHISNAQIYETFEYANKKHPSSFIFPIEVKITGVPLNKKTNLDSQFNKITQKEHLEKVIVEKSSENIKKNKI